MKKVMFRKGLLAALLAACVALPQSAPFTPASYASGRTAGEVTASQTNLKLGSSAKDGYDRYIARYEGTPAPKQALIVKASAFSAAEGMAPRLVGGVEGADGEVLETSDAGTVSWSIDVPEDGLYEMAVRYRAMAGKGSNMAREIWIDGKLPFAEAKNIVFSRVWKNDGETVRDEKGNDMYTPQSEALQWQVSAAQSSDGRYSEPFRFYLSKGKHKLSLVSVKEPMMIDYIKLDRAKAVPAYEEIKAGYERDGRKAARDAFVKVQGEAAGMKSSSSLVPMMDRRSPATEPYHVSKVRLNTIGSYEAGQWIEWEFDVPQNGLYKIGVKYEQNISRGVTSYRKVMIDGEVPFAELEAVPFEFATGWQLGELGPGDGGEPYLFYLTEGKHRLRMDVTLGDMAAFLRTIESSVLELNTIYRKIVMITGTVPDEYRDYQLDVKLPEIIGKFREQADIIAAISERLERTSGGGENTGTLGRLVYQLRDMADHPGTIARRLETFKSNTGSLGTWVFTMKEMPLAIDYIVVASPERKMPRASASFLANAKHQAGTFFASFFNDYNAFGSGKEGAETIKVWITMGLDQAKIMKRMIEETFAPATGISVELQVVTEPVLLQAMLAGRGPDVAFAVPDDKPLNYALRGGVEDLSGYPGFAELKSEYHESAFVPYEFDGATYALPVEQYFPVLYYRKDILEELGLTVPQTWDDVYAMIPELQKHNLLFGFPIQVLVKTGSNVQENASLPINQTYGTMLFQEDGELYQNGNKKSALDTEKSVQAFMQWSELYTTYKLPLTTDFVNRFRSGEMPIGIYDYNRANVVSVVAPELNGIWDFTLVPGTRKPDGTIRREVPASGSGAVMLKSSAHKDAAWTFMRWWAEAKTQARYGWENEALFGPAGRVATANREAADLLAWQAKDYKTIMAQWEWAKGIPQVPGGYFTGRHLDNAFRSVVISNEDPREAIEKYTIYINDEIKKKREEFGYPAE
ncbi:extracellular solute-binding protein [Paenibacillus methanolicus]|uniref:ABC-type glycerol-3-phosphate transport system substrate-binding protein n=1 Tax=Paenibacillus methanolicus TaxID=582686 RepID=A0A5S5CJ48_9BACL|nr:extracellular solute-binding protein [Paenibacillus methanolicus]TYP79826.1 ABC-type glycerol-3-phosphate transport system substrate-binding protein [Paenibacillus methanolicus]